MKILKIKNREGGGFGIQVNDYGKEYWINKVGDEHDIPVKVVEKGDKTYYNIDWDDESLTGIKPKKEKKPDFQAEVLRRLDLIEKGIAKLLSG